MWVTNSKITLNLTVLFFQNIAIWKVLFVVQGFVAGNLGFDKFVWKKKLDSCVVMQEIINGQFRDDIKAISFSEKENKCFI